VKLKDDATIYEYMKLSALQWTTAYTRAQKRTFSLSIPTQGFVNNL